MKIKLQDIWRNRQHWDGELPEHLQQIVEDWTTSSASLNEIQILRYYNLLTAQPIQLHVFCDASTQALTTVISIQFVDKTAYRTKLLLGKTRVTPLKPQTISKRKLQAAIYTGR